jgi:hypothetical protein
MSNINQEKAQMESVTTQLIALINAANKQDLLERNNPDHRSVVSEWIFNATVDLRPDPDAWTSLETKVPYEDYLAKRREEGTLSEVDLTRAGLQPTDFDNKEDYFLHMQRVRATVDEKHGGEGKRCSSCGQTKPRSSFPVRKGSVCYTCRSKKYRERKAEERRINAKEPS